MMSALFGLFVLLLQLLPAIICAAIFSSKGRSAFGGFLLGLFAGVFGIVVAILWPRLEEARPIVTSHYQQRERLAHTERQLCTHCGYKNDSAARFCQHCGTTIDHGFTIEQASSVDALKAEQRFGFD